jgi:hypothetical protein
VEVCPLDGSPPCPCPKSNELFIWFHSPPHNKPHDDLPLETVRQYPKEKKKNRVKDKRPKKKGPK